VASRVVLSSIELVSQYSEAEWLVSRGSARYPVDLRGGGSRSSLEENVKLAAETESRPLQFTLFIEAASLLHSTLRGLIY
jgi:hypothetical protein